MRAKGECLENAVAERFCGSLKRERTALWPYATRQEARDDVVEYLDMVYNSTRLHSSLGYVSPNDDEGLAKVASLSVRFPLTTTWRFLRTGELPAGVVLKVEVSR